MISKKFIAVGFMLSIITSPVIAESYVCESSATLEGLLKTEISSSASGNEKSNEFPVLKLKQGISVGCQKDDDTCEPEKDISVFQLSMNSNQMAKFKKLKGRLAQVRGKLFHSDNGNQYTPVLITVESIAVK